MAAVVYEGVAGGGDLFQGQKFFIAQRVPGRLELIKNVERNGGFVVPIEKNADVLIADHAKPKLAPANSFSWRYLKQSMEKGQLEDLETHRISSSGKTGLPGGPSQPKKSTRTPFTLEDDTAISIWVAKAELSGLSVRGNEIYEQFADKNPRHTAQSWRDHWIKQLFSQPRPEIDMDSTDWPKKNKDDRSRRAIPPAAQSNDVVTTPNATGARKHPVVPSPSLPISSYSPKDEPPFTEEAPSTKHVPFTKEDIAILEKEDSDIVNIPPGTLVYAWEAFAKEHKRHTAGEWCNYYHNVFKPRKCQEGEDKDARKVNPKANRGNDSTSTANTTPVRATASSTSQIESRDTARRRKLGEDEVITSRPPESETSKYQPRIGTSADKTQFLADLRELSSALKRQIEPSFRLYGRKHELFDLWSVVNKPEFGGFRKVEETNRWLQVAIKLEINTYKHKAAHSDLKTLYSDNLVDFDTYISTRETLLAKRRTPPTKSTEPATPVTAISTQAAEQAQSYSSISKNGGTKERAFLTKSTEPVTPVTAIPTQAALQTHAYSSMRKDGKTKGRASLAKSTEPVTPGAAIPTKTPEPAHILSGGLSTRNTLRPATVLLKESANKHIAARRIRQSLGHGELAFLQSISEFAGECLPYSVIFEPIVSKRKISLFSVWSASLPLLGHFDDIESREVWDDLATKLGFETSAHPSAPDELRQICEDFLVDFYDFYILREQDKIKEQALGQLSDNQGQAEEEAEEGSEDNLVSTSLAFQTASPERQKRPHDQDNISPVVESRPSSSHSHSRNKRPRISKGKERAYEIPSTPEHIYNSHLNMDGKLPAHSTAKDKKLIETNIKYFPPPSLSEEPDSSPSRQLWSEAKLDHTPPSQNNDEAEAQSQTDSQCNENIKDFCDHFMAEGFKLEIIQQMMYITTMDAEFAEKLLSDHANGLEIPKNVPGVWTEEDDNGVKSHVQSGGYKRALRKHGETRCLKRQNFLREFEEVQAEDA